MSNKKLIVGVVSTMAVLSALVSTQGAPQATPGTYADMRWRSIGPTRAGRARAVSGVPTQSNVFYIGFDNGGVWRSTDFGSTWVPLVGSSIPYLIR